MANPKYLRQYRATRDLYVDQIYSLYSIAERAKEDRTLRSRLRVSYKNVEQIYEEFEKHHINVVAALSASEDADLETEKEIRNDFFDKYILIKTTHFDIFEKDKIKNEVNPSTSCGGQQQISDYSNLPKVHVPKFDGAYQNWPQFKDLFDSIVHKKVHISNIEKFQYLISALDKEPLVVVKAIPMTEANYLIAYQALVDRYNNPRLLANSYWSQIINAPSLTHENAVGLRTLVNTFQENLAALKTLNLPVTEWSCVIFNILIQKLDVSTLKQFEIHDASTDIPSYKKLKLFLEKHCTALESIALTTNKGTQLVLNSSSSKRNQNFNKNRNNQSFVTRTENHNSKNKYSCHVCNGNHLIYHCNVFLAKSPFERYNYVKQKNWCINCLHSAHDLNNCASQSVCRTCQLRHHSLLHYSNRDYNPSSQQQSAQANFQTQFNTNCATQAQNIPIQPTHQSLISSNSQNHSIQSTTSNASALLCNENSNSNYLTTTVLLGTAVVEIQDSRGYFQKIRVLVDSGSGINILTQKCANRLSLVRSKSSLTIYGIGQNPTPSSGIVHCTIRPQGQTQPLFNFKAEVLSKICSDLPNSSICTQNWDSIRSLNLADPHFNSPGTIDGVLSAELFPIILREGFVPGNVNMPSAINTVFGWILMGKFKHASSSYAHSFFISSEINIDSTLKKFWELEEIPKMQIFSQDDLQCEHLFVKNVSRDSTGRYTVALPFKDNSPFFQNSREIAFRRFLSMEKRLLHDSTLCDSYKEVINDYLSSGHMVPVSAPATNSGNFYYIPHHYVLKPDSTTTRMRIVFDASTSDSQGLSLNKTLLPGPKLQKNIFDILCHFRIHSFVFTADIRQMYRQIWVTEADKNYQRILWRSSPHEPVQDYALQTVSFGVSPSAFLAQRTLVQLAQDEKKNYSLASQLLLADIYVDDIVSSFTSLEEALEAQNQLIDILSKGGFELRKWASNSNVLLQNIPISHRHEQALTFSAEDDNSYVKILGLKWNSTSDTFSYSVEVSNRPCTKRNILSSTARVFDPLGFLAPLTFFAKFLIQHLWTLGLGWDESTASDVAEKWSRFQAELPILSNYQIPRILAPTAFDFCQLHGFADSSERGYAAVIYFRFCYSNEIKVTLVGAKSKVAPIKKVSLPRLELCAAVLLANLLSHVSQIYSDKIKIEQVFAYSDSKVVLAWLKSSPHRWKTFVSNRVSLVQEQIPPSCWFHVRSEDNPADCASRGLLPLELVNHSLWWTGPSWLKLQPHQWPISSEIAINDSIVGEEQRNVTLLGFSSVEYFNVLMEKYSSLGKIQRVVAFSRRWFYNFRNKDNPKFEYFSEHELHEALLVLVKHVQHVAFQEVFSNLEKKRPISKPIRKLNPFLDTLGIIRVGGRLKFSGLSYDSKHPALMPRNHRLTDLIIDAVHRENLHPGLQSMQFLLAQNFWILSPRRAIRQRLSQCIKCFRFSPTTLQPSMGDLPSFRVNQIKPFSIVGVDYGGPFYITLGKSRGCKSQKAYLCLFVCAATKALHLELASDLTSEAFLAALRRFIARRGRCSKVFSDQGTNFVGAYKELNQMFQQACATEKIEWMFNPPSSPHFGGLFEAGIKSVKSFLLKIIGNQILTYEEFYTVLCQIESILNSRPLCAMSSDPNDLSVLTPGHFLTLEPLSCLPDPDLSHLSVNRLSRWQLLQRLHQDFWKRWHSDYLNSLQQRQRWNKDSDTLSIDALVLVKNDQMAPLNWKLGRVVKLHPGRDDIARVATIRTSQGLLQRPLVKLCVLPIS